MTDVLVVGGGPAGATTGMLLARHGYDVLIVDRRHFPREKPCGDCIGAGVLPLLERLGVLGSIEALPHARLEGWSIGVEGGPRFRGVFDAPNTQPAGYSLAVRRNHLDAVLLGEARAAGCRTLTGWQVEGVLVSPRGVVHGVRGRNEGGEPASLAARVVVGADGLRSIISRRLGLVRRRPRLRRTSLTAHLVGIPGAGPCGEMHLAEGYCLGLAPVGRQTWNVTVVAETRRTSARHPTGGEALFAAGLDRFVSLRDRLRDARCATTGRPPGRGIRLLASGPFDWPVRAPITDGAVLVGDAAGYFDPFTGQGIRHALQGAEILAEELATVLAAGNVTRAALRGYARRHASLIRPSRLLERGVDAVAWRPRLRAWAFRRLAGAPAAADAIVSAAAGLMPVHCLISGGAAATFLSARPPLEVPG